MAVEVIYRPNRPVMPDGSLAGPDAHDMGAGGYLVTQGYEIVAAYNLVYFRTSGEVVADLLVLLGSGRLSSPHEEDYAVWYGGQLQVVITRPMDDEHPQVVWFKESRNASDVADDTFPVAGWPSYEQWVAAGRGDIEFDLEKYPGAKPE